MTEAEKKEIDGMTYMRMLSAWRFAPTGDPQFQGEKGKYFAEVMKGKKTKLDPLVAVSISKSVGW